MKHRDYHDEKIHRYAKRLDQMTDVELAQEGIHQLKVSFAVAVVIMVVMVWGLVFTEDPPGMLVALLAFTLISLPFMAIEWVRNKRIINGYECDEHGNITE